MSLAPSTWPASSKLDVAEAASGVIFVLSVVGVEVGPGINVTVFPWAAEFGTCIVTGCPACTVWDNETVLFVVPCGMDTMIGLPPVVCAICPEDNTIIFTPCWLVTVEPVTVVLAEPIVDEPALVIACIVLSPPAVDTIMICCPCGPLSCVAPDAPALFNTMVCFPGAPTI